MPSEFISIDQIINGIEFPAKLVELAKLEFEIKLAFEESFTDHKQMHCVLVDHYFDRIGFERVRKLLDGLFASKSETETPDTLTLFFEFLADVAQKFAQKLGLGSSFRIFAQSFQFLLLHKFNKLCSETTNKQRNLLIIKFLQSFTVFFKANLQDADRGALNASTLFYLSVLADSIDPGEWESAVRQISEVYFSSPELYFQTINGRVSLERQRFEEFSHHFLTAFVSIFQMALLSNRNTFDIAFGRLETLFNYFFDNLKKVWLLSQRLFMIDLIRSSANQTALAITEAAAFARDEDMSEELGYLSSLKVNANTHIETLATEAARFIEKNFLLKLIGNKKLLYEFDEFLKEFAASFERAGFDFRQCGVNETFYRGFGQRARSLSELITVQPLNQNQLKELAAKLNIALLTLIPKQAQATFLATFSRNGN